MSIFRLSYFIVMLSLVSCQYELDDVFNPNITEPPDIPPFGININLPEVENFTLLLPDRVFVSLDSCDAEIYDVDFYIDNVVTGKFKEGNLYHIDLVPNDNNLHKIRVEVYTSSGSNSIIDELGIEGYKFTSSEWTYSFKEFDHKSNARSSLVEDGALIKWKPHTGLNPFKYVLERPDTGLQIETDSLQLIDANYVGEVAEYDVYVKTDYGIKFLWATHETKNYLPRVKYEFINNRTALTWKSSIFEEKIKEYRIYNKSYYPMKLVGILPGNSNFFFPEDYFECILGFPNEMVIETVPLANAGSDSVKYQVGINVKFGVPYGFHDNVVINNSNGAFTQETYGRIRYHNTHTGLITNLEDVGAGSYAISADFNMLVVPSKMDLSIYNLDKLHSHGTYELVKKVSLDADFIPPGISKFDLSNDGIIVTAIKDSIWVYDLMNEKLIGKVHGLSSHRYVISPDGKKIVLFQPYNIYIYSITDGSLNLFNVVKYEDVKMEIYDNSNLRKLSGDENIFYIFGDHHENIQFRRYDDLSVVKSFPAQYRKLFSIDEDNNRYITSGFKLFEGGFWIYVNDLNTGERLFEIQKDKDLYESELKSFISNNIVYTAGYKYILPK